MPPLDNNMKLPIPFLKSKKESSLYYLALLLTSERASTVILEESAGKIKIINSKNQFFTGNIEDLPLEELIETIDKAISRAEEVLPPDVEIRKTVFGVKESWVEEETKKIKKNYLKKLKKVCDSLELSPIGFMVVSEAISHLMQEDEGAPLSAIFAELGKKFVTLTLFRGGKSVQTIEGLLEGGYATTVDTLLKHFTIEVLPARIILYDSEISEELVQQFIGHQWSKSLPFLHMPQISVLPSGFDGRAVTFGAAAQMGFEVLDIDAGPVIQTYDTNAALAKEEKKTHTAAHKLHTEDEKAEADAEEKSSETKHVAGSETLIPTENFGFVLEKDIAEVGPSPETHHKESNTSNEDSHKETISDSLVDTTPIENTEETPDESAFEKNIQEGNVHAKRASFFGSFLGSIRLPKIHIPSFGPKGVLLPIFIVLLLIGALIGGAYYFYFNKVNASVIVTLTPKKVTENPDVVFTADGNNDLSNNIVAAKSVDGTLDGDLTIGATGKKDVGEKAKGSVTIYNNNTDSDITLSVGSAIKSESGLSFILDKEVTVASASGDIFSGTKPGTTTVDVTANDIGTNYNLPSGTKFSVGNNSFLAAKNDSAFSGGSKKTVTVVSKDDLLTLKTDLTKNLESKASGELVKQAQGDSVVLPIVLSTNIDNTKYDKNAGDEAKTVKLSGTLTYSGLSYQNTDVKEFSKALLEKNYAKNMTSDENTLDIKVNDAKKKSDKEITATLTINAALLPKIDNQSIAKQISGKSVKDAEAIISHFPQVEHTTIVYTPNISFLATLFPRLPNHVTVTVSSN